QNGQKELVYTRDFVYFWEFSAPGVYHARRSDFSFARAVKDATVSDVDQDGILELAFLCSNYDLQPPTQYIIKEYEYTSFYYVGFDLITGFYQDWADARFAIGDFDNDGIINIVSGNFGLVSGLYPIDIQYFCYDSTELWNFSQHWLYTGYAISCCTPVIADFDDDILNELYAGGLYANGGTAWLYEGTGLGVGAVSWIDTTTSPNGPNEAGYGVIDYMTSVVSIHILPGFPDDSQLLLWCFSESQFENLWQSSIQDCVAYHNPFVVDTDFDQKKNIILAGNWWRKIHDWEQTSVGVGYNPTVQIPSDFELLKNRPNPFNETTIIPYRINANTDVAIKICDILGQELFNYKMDAVPPGEYQLNWDAAELSSGIYIIFFKAGDYQESSKAVLLK
ncbi:MAG: T9SS type A sorting domain-containing protein, partial [FCB group bacterium]|nr:T9SS type A sorting domain-containing protein [FCB group bacterium]